MMKDKNEILQIGSIVSVCVESEKGTLTELMIIGHLCLRKKFICHYDYVCVPYPFGIEDSICYINDSDIVRVVSCCPLNLEDEKQLKWSLRKQAEYMAYYNNYKVSNRPNDKNENEKQFILVNEFAQKENKNKICKAIGIALLLGGMILAVLLTNCWWTGICAALFFILGYIIKT